MHDLLWLGLYRWVPVLFGWAAVILGLSYPYLDQLAVKHKQVGLEHSEPCCSLALA